MLGEWSNGFSGEGTITNITPCLWSGWTASFNLNGTLQSVWSAHRAARNGNRYTVTNEAWNVAVQPGQRLVLGFNASPSFAQAGAPCHFMLHGIVTGQWNVIRQGRSGTTCTFGNASWNGSLKAGGHMTFGFNADPGGTIIPPSNITIRWGLRMISARPAGPARDCPGRSKGSRLRSLVSRVPPPARLSCADRTAPEPAAVPHREPGPRRTTGVLASLQIAPGTLSALVAPLDRSIPHPEPPVVCHPLLPGGNPLIEEPDTRRNHSPVPNLHPPCPPSSKWSSPDSPSSSLPVCSPSSCSASARSSPAAPASRRARAD
ncbi:MAG: cellulose binding domain-containing protein [Verrucomicrobiae bacterium]|nr:cellulose binding domain-containing protein [Verrucomicrobiae bacterium]